MYGDWKKDCWYLVGIDEEGDWTFYIKDKFGITDFKEHATCFKSPMEAKAAKAWLESELEKLGYPEDENVNSVENWIVAYYDEKSGCLFDAVTDKYLFNYDGADDENPDDLEESISLLESAGYRVINETVDIVDEVMDLLKHYGYDEDTIENEIMDYKFIDDLAEDGYNAEEIVDKLLYAVYGRKGKFTESTMNEAINNPDDPATSRQLWALFCMTKKDYRGKGLTKQQASDLIGELKSGKKIEDVGENKPVKNQKEDENALVKVGDIYHRHWGYDMSINTYYKVLMVRGKKATVVELGKKVISGCLQQGKVVPDEKNRETKTTIALIKPDGSLRIRFMGDGNYDTYHKWDGQPDYEDHMD
jgi:hypothetical protein